MDSHAAWPPKKLRPGQGVKRWLHEKTHVSLNWITRRAKAVIRLPEAKVAEGERS
jgi:hypothetical protein